MSAPLRSPFAPKFVPNLYPVPGVELGTAAANVKYKGRRDLLMAFFQPNTAAAGVFTVNEATAAPVLWSRRVIETTPSDVRALVVNAGNANAFTGMRGHKICADVAAEAARLAGADPAKVLLASTGVIGEPMALAPFKTYLPRISEGLSASLYKDAAEAIMTTDTYPKMVSRLTKLDGHVTPITGIAKGSGMIAPNMATMLAFVFTSAAIAPVCLDALLREAVDSSFHAITVDSDTSTNDTVLLFATGANGQETPIDDPSDRRLDEFRKALGEIMIDLAQQVIKDGEGARKFVTVMVEAARDTATARAVGFSIANSPLVKTAIAGEDPNWGRIIMAAGKAGAGIDPDALKLWIGPNLVAKGGAVHSRYSEEKAAEHMKGQDILLRLDLGQGDAATTVWTTDLTHGYIDINADYRS
ncbi:bifunctional glutamate N-acetyltransferase/amino-acid acetyltransferase ArgJ [Eilatimonas milleporae]|uniref:Arginine biosynthesis bifunctional protein ArgJ n=1 Tax=Eilatimonas milleporae TaxID=911205 RepID=A0A3M0C2W9_9PROT|nr:bifunctional glutamate N-acetyltransferase/amino-acid acetyltransferase ArgJ [Eilatimonas milleporae]RMB01519.1 glutamate N-acetyltransferase [Eilatimonas milleporae]